MSCQADPINKGRDKETIIVRPIDYCHLFLYSDLHNIDFLHLFLDLHFCAVPCGVLTLFTHVILVGDGDKLQGMEIKWQPCKVLWVTSVRDSVSWV